MKKRILIFSIAYHPFIGGAEVAVKEITQRLQDCDFTILTLMMGRGVSRFEKKDNVSIYRVGFSGSSRLSSSLNLPLIFSKYFFPFSATWKALKLNKKEKFDLTWSIMANYAGFAALFFKLLKPKIPFLLTLQEGDPLEYIRKRVGVFMPLYKMIFTKADKIQAISHFLADYALDMGHKGKIEIVPNGVNIELFNQEYSLDAQKQSSEIVGKKNSEIILITTSRLVNKNAVDIIIGALKFLPDNFKLFIAGQGEDEDKLLNLTKELKLESRVKFGGFVPYEELPSLLKASDIFVRPSRSEGLGNSFLEAMAARIPVIGTSVGGIPDFLEDGKTGFFVKVDDSKDLAEKVRTLSEDKNLIETVTSSAQKMVLEKYSWDSVSERMKKIFKEL